MPQTNPSFLAKANSCLHAKTIHSFDELKEAVREIACDSPLVTIVEKPNRLLLMPTGEGFPIDMMLDDNGAPMLFLGYWFDDGECGYEAILQLVRQALSSELRLRSTFYNGYRGKRPYGYALERRFSDGSWVTIAENTFPTLGSLWFKRQYFESFDQYPAAVEVSQ